MATGNIVLGVIAISNGEINQAMISFAMSFCTTIVGGQLSCLVIENTSSRGQALFAFTFLSVVALIANELVLVYQIINRDYFALLLAATSGAVLHWHQKTGYTHSLYTMNLIKVSESIYRFTRNISQGGAKLRGDLLVILGMFASFIGGAIVCQLCQFLFGRETILPLLVLQLTQLIHQKYMTYKRNIAQSKAKAISQNNKPSIPDTSSGKPSIQLIDTKRVITDATQTSFSTPNGDKSITISPHEENERFSDRKTYTKDDNVIHETNLDEVFVDDNVTNHALYGTLYASLEQKLDNTKLSMVDLLPSEIARAETIRASIASRQSQSQKNESFNLVSNPMNKDIP